MTSSVVAGAAVPSTRSEGTAWLLVSWLGGGEAQEVRTARATTRRRRGVIRVNTARGGEGRQSP